MTIEAIKRQRRDIAQEQLKKLQQVTNLKQYKQIYQQTPAGAKVHLASPKDIEKIQQERIQTIQDTIKDYEIKEQTAKDRKRRDDRRYYRDVLNNLKQGLQDLKQGKFYSPKALIDYAKQKAAARERRREARAEQREIEEARMAKADPEGFSGKVDIYDSEGNLKATQYIKDNVEVARIKNPDTPQAEAIIYEPTKFTFDEKNITKEVEITPQAIRERAKIKEAERPPILETLQAREAYFQDLISGTRKIEERQIPEAGGIVVSEFDLKRMGIDTPQEILNLEKIDTDLIPGSRVQTFIYKPDGSPQPPKKITQKVANITESSIKNIVNFREAYRDFQRKLVTSPFGTAKEGLDLGRSYLAKGLSWKPYAASYLDLAAAKKMFETADKMNLLDSNQRQLLQNKISEGERLLQEQKKEIQTEIKLRDATYRGDLTAIVSEIAVSVGVPIVGVTILGISIGAIVEKDLKTLGISIKDVAKGMVTKDLTLSEAAEIAEKTLKQETTIPPIIIFPIIKIIEYEGDLIEGLKSFSQSTYEKFIEFTTQTSLKEEIKSEIKELDEMERELISNRELYEENSLEQALKEIREAKEGYNEQLERIDKELTLQKQVGVAIAVGAAAILTRRVAGWRAGRRQVVEKQKTAAEFKKNQEIIKKDPATKVGRGTEKVGTQTGEFSVLKGTGVLKTIKPLNIQKVDWIQTTQAYASRVPKILKVNVPPVLKGIKGVKQYDMIYTPPRLSALELSRMSINQIKSMLGWKVYYQNALTFNVTLKNGTQKAFSLLFTTNKPLGRFRNLQSALRYSRGKKFVEASKLRDSEIIRSQVFRIRGGKFTPEDVFLGRATPRGVEVRREPSIARRPGMDAEDVWSLARKKSESITKDLAERQKNLMQFKEGTLFSGREVQKVREVVTITEPITVDVSYLQFLIQNTPKLRGLRLTLKPTSSEKALLNLVDKVESAAKGGTKSLKITQETLKQLSPEDLQIIRSSALATPPVAPTVKVPQRIVQETKSVRATTTGILERANTIEKQTEKIINDLNQKRLTGTLTQQEVNKKIKELTSIQNSIQTQQQQVSSSASKTQQIVAQIQKDDTLFRTAQEQLSTTKQTQRQLQNLKSRFTKQTTSINNLINTLRIRTTGRPGSPRTDPKRRISLRIPKFLDAERQQLIPSKKKTYKEQPGYYPYVKIDGKYKRITDKPLIKRDALNTTAYVVDWALARKGKIKPTKESPIIPRYNLPGAYFEKHKNKFKTKEKEGIKYLKEKDPFLKDTYGERIGAKAQEEIKRLKTQHQKRKPIDFKKETEQQKKKMQKQMKNMQKGLFS